MQSDDAPPQQEWQKAAVAIGLHTGLPSLSSLSLSSVSYLHCSFGQAEDILHGGHTH